MKNVLQNINLLVIFVATAIIIG